MSNVVKWIVEEKSADGEVTYLREFDTYDDALNIYNSLKLENQDSFVSIEKSVKRFLVE